MKSKSLFTKNMYLIISITKYEDEWFTVWIRKESKRDFDKEIKGQSYHISQFTMYQCDQIGGVIDLLTDLKDNKLSGFILENVDISKLPHVNMKYLKLYEEYNDQSYHEITSSDYHSGCLEGVEEDFTEWEISKLNFLNLQYNFAGGFVQYYDKSKFTIIIHKIKDEWFKITHGDPKIEKYKQECRKLFLKNIRLYGIKPKSLGLHDTMVVAYKKPDKVCVKPPTKQETPNVVPAVEPKKETKPFCNGGTLFRNQIYYPGYSPMLGNNWKVDVKGKANFGKSLPTQTNELVMVCKDQGIEKRFYFPLESDFQEFKQKQPMGKFDNTQYKYVNDGSSFPSDDFYKTLKLAGTKGQNVTTIQDGDVVKYWYHYSPIPLDGLGAREYFGVSSKEHLS